MDIKTSKIELVKMILSIENVDFIKRIAEFINKDDFWSELTVEQKKEIKKGIQELDSGKKISFNDVLKKIS